MRSTENFIKALRAGDLPRENPGGLFGTALLDVARVAHPEHLCAKHAYGALVVSSGQGESVVVGRNGQPDATPRHLEEYTARNLLNIARNIPETEPERALLVGYLEGLDPERVLGCDYIAAGSGADTCLKGFPFLNDGQQATRPSDKYCPHWRAGCTEQKLLKAAPYILELQQRHPDQHIIVTNVKYKKGDPLPSIKYYLNGQEHEEKVEPIQGALPQHEKVLVSETIPCLKCAAAIIDQKVKRVSMAHFSQYSVSEDGQVVGELVDGHDVESVTKMHEAGVELVFRADTPRMILREEEH